MGNVTNVVLISATGDRDAAQQVSDWLEDHGHPRLLEVHDAWDRAPGAEKRTSVELRIGALNYLDHDALIDAFSAIEWRVPARARLMYFSVTAAPSKRKVT